MDQRKLESEITFESTPFKQIRPSLDSAIENVIKKVYDGKFSSGEITLKIKVAIDERTVLIPHTSYVDGMPYEFKSPTFENTVTTTLKQVEKEESSYMSNKIEIRETDESFALFEIPDSQMKLELQEE